MSAPAASVDGNMRAPLAAQPLNAVAPSAAVASPPAKTPAVSTPVRAPAALGLDSVDTDEVPDTPEIKRLQEVARRALIKFELAQQEKKMAAAIGLARQQEQHMAWMLEQMTSIEITLQGLKFECAANLKMMREALAPFTRAEGGCEAD